LKFKAGWTILVSQFLVLLVFLLLTFVNEICDLPHYLLNDPPIAVGQRTGEVFIELSVFVLVMAIEWVLVINLLKRIKILEGLLPICTRCKKIRLDDKWEQLETYITNHSLAKFSHSICPDCVKELYPEFGRVRKPHNRKTLRETREAIG